MKRRVMIYSGSFANICRTCMFSERMISEDTSYHYICTINCILNDSKKCPKIKPIESLFKEGEMAQDEAKRWKKRHGIMDNGSPSMVLYQVQHIKSDKRK